ncbi:pimeloyl-ACP methyl ester esterase BioH [Kaarinaea lacus]
MLYYESHGEGDPVVLLHGWAMNGRVWDDVVPRLAQFGRVITVDLPGHGKSDLPANGHYDLDTVCDEIKPVLENNANATVLGWSLGGLVALNLAHRYPELIHKLVLVAGSPQFVQSSDWPHAVQQEIFASFATNLADDYRATIQRFLAIQALGSQQGKHAIKALREKVFLNGEPQMKALREGLKLLSNSNVRPYLSNIRCSVLIVLGEKDRLIPPAAGADTVALLPTAQLAVIPGAGHAPFISHAKEFLSITTAFINESQ